MNKLKFNLHYSKVFCTDKMSRKYYSFLSTNMIRQTFIDYFASENHSYIKSSPVKPFNDPSLEFVNAGMNQFKNVFLGLEAIPVAKACNSQKCIRVGGKHNDLDSVGKDTYHHTFFEMLGNWSFNNYFKKEACKLAWNLITSKPYAIDPNRLYVTYFKGDDSLNLLPDLETKEIWLEIGVPEHRVLPFGLKENFWEMGLHGPCGPSTEIHYDHLGNTPRPHLVNKDSADLTELWNNVFIQFNRLEDGTLIPLEKHFVDTGMGLERLVALLQGKSSNYDTDIFVPYFDAIAKISGFSKYSGKFGIHDAKGLDTAYRILADHTRMVSVAIADNVFPDVSHGLRRVIRKGILIAEKFLPGNGVSLMVELSKVSGESFSHIFPEVTNNLRQIECVLRDENELWQEIKAKVKNDWENLKKDNPHLESLDDVQSIGLISSFNELMQRKIPPKTVLPEDLCIILYDRYGLNPQVIEELARVCDYSVNISQLQKDILLLKEKNKALIHSNQKLDLPKNTLEYVSNYFLPTDDSFKANYTKNSKGYNFENVRSKVQAIIKDGKCISNISSLFGSDLTVGVLLDKTNMWSSLKGGGDRGIITLFDGDNNEIGKVFVERVFNLGGHVCHTGNVQMSLNDANIPLEDLMSEISIDHDNRLNLMRNTSAAHLLSFALRTNFVCNTLSFRASHKEFSATFLMFGHHLQSDDIMSLEEKMNHLISAGLNIELTKKSTDDLVGTGDLHLPPYVSPNMKSIYLVSIDGEGEKRFREVTIGPNVMNTRDIDPVCLLNFETRNRGRNVTISGVSDHNATVFQNAKTAISSIESEDLEDKVKIAKLNSLMMENRVPFELKPDFMSKLQELKIKNKQKQRNNKIHFIQKYTLEAKERSENCVVLYAGKETNLTRLIKKYVDFPIMLFACNGNYFSAACRVPEGSSLSAAAWMNNVANKLGGHCTASKDSSDIFLMRPIRIDKDKLKEIIQMAEMTAKKEAASSCDGL
ncbi:alanine--tRNA ligase, mitochondrial isoform X2 [Halyomorpha halys]|uniref:alanine--tRNA ligase, mitochondrial isoform X2 n=1 Tax=Halyomorpha halys TaxID=286706 RepID=UPI0006D4DC88|nr:alanine--tRNA ligase, mitochondrial isoform X2 [Halyomorpha halys]